ncbi:flavin reductase family protein [Achromobacter pestifer]
MSGIVVLRSIAGISSVNAHGGVNLGLFSCHTFGSRKPHMIGVDVGRKVGKRKDTAENILANRRFVVNVGDEVLLDPLHDSAQEHPPEISEVDVLGLSVLPGTVIYTPRFAAEPISLECRFHSVTPFGDTGAEFFVGEVVMFHIRDGLLQHGKIDTALLRRICRRGGPNYASLRAIGTKRGIRQAHKSIIKPEAA